MTRVLRAPGLAEPISVPGPAAWGPVAIAARDQGYAQGLEDGRAQGRRDLAHLADGLDSALATCITEIAAARRSLLARTMDVAELLVTTVLRHQPDTLTEGLLLRVRETIDGIDPGALELRVHPELVAPVRALVADGLPVPVTVAEDPSLALGEFRLHADWANADATWDHYLAAAHEAVAMHVAALHEDER